MQLFHAGREENGYSLITSTGIRVVHVLYSFGAGGLEKGVAALVQNSSPDIEHVVVCLAVSGESERLLPSGTKVVELHKSPGNSLGFLWKLSRTLKSLKPSVIHTRNWSGMDGVIASRLAGIDSVVHGEHGWGMEDPDGLNRKRIQARRFLSRWVREYTCVSKAIELWLNEVVCVKRPVNHIYNGVDVKMYSPGKEKVFGRKQLGIPENSFVVGAVGRLDPIKDHLTLFRSIQLAREKIPNVCLIVVGDGPERDGLEQEAGEGIVFLGNRTDVPEILKTLDLMVLSSLNEGISNTILEAMAAELPVAATLVGGNSELVQDGISGVLVPSGDAQAMANAIIEYASDSGLRSAHSRAGRERVVANFSVDAMVRGYELVYRRLCSSLQ